MRRYIMIPLCYEKDNVNRVRVAMSDPMDMRAMDEFQIITGLQLDPVIATRYEIETALDRYYADAETAKVLERYKREHQELEKTDEANNTQVDNSPVVLLVRSLMQQAARQHASDIHIEAMERVVRVRFRIDGVLYERFRYDIEMLPAIVARIKIISGMDISEKRKPQDGRVSMTVDHNEFDVRVSILPTVYGEKCVMRLAQTNVLTKDKSELGLRGRDIETFNKHPSVPVARLLVPIIPSSMWSRRVRPGIGQSSGTTYPTMRMMRPIFTQPEREMRPTTIIFIPRATSPIPGWGTVAV